MWQQSLFSWSISPSLSIFIFFSLSPPLSAESEIEQRGDCIRALMRDRVEGETESDGRRVCGGEEWE